jgi:SAM-dependent methyltransferase
MSRADIIEHFSALRVTTFAPFRALCNALKALGIAVAVKALRETRKGRICVCDVGCGKGGDVGKWMPHRPKALLGVDGSAPCIEEARARHANLVTNGRGSTEAAFRVVDLCSPGAALPADSESVDVVCSNFFLQFAAEAREALERVLGECARVLAPGGVFLCIVPDGDRVWALLQSDGNDVGFGHFLIRKCRDVAYAPDGPPFGVAYNFSLGAEACTEFVLLPALLEAYLYKMGFAPALPGARFSMPAQAFFLEHPGNAANGIVKGQSVSELDWLSMGLFRVFLARKGGGQNAASSVASLDAPLSS